MAEYIQSNASEAISVNAPITYDSSIPCNRGCVFHEDGTGVFILRGKVANSSNCFARYQITLNANVAVPEGGAVTAIALGIIVEGELKQSSKAIFTPQAVNEFGNLTSTAIVTVPRGCCISVATEYVDATTNDPAVTPTPTITVSNANLVITRIA